MWELESSGSNRNVFGEISDVVAFTVPILIGVILAPFFYVFVSPDSIPIWGYIIFVACLDVAHVWSTLFRTHFNTAENRRRRILYNGLPLGAMCIQIGIHYYFGDAIFWTLVGYLAIYHFIKQQYGLLMVAECREKNFAQIKRDKYFFYALSLFPILLWHCDASRSFDWFNRDDPFPFAWFPRLMSEFILVECDGVMWTPIFVLNVLWALVWVSFGLHMAGDALLCHKQKRQFPITRTLLLFYSGLTWSVGVLCNHRLIALAFLNLYHAFPSILIVFCVSMNRWRCLNGEFSGRPRSVGAQECKAADRIGKFFTKRQSRFYAYVAFLLLLGIGEEVLWELLVWHDYVDASWVWGWSPDGGSGYCNPLLYSFVVSLLILPQTSHYLLDMYIWKMGVDHVGREENPELRRYLALVPMR